MPAQDRLDLQFGAARVVGAAGSFLVPPTGGIQSIIRNGLGDWTVTTDPYDINNTLIRVQRISSASDDCHFSVSPIDQTHVRIFADQGSAATPRRYYLMGGVNHNLGGLVVSPTLGGTLWTSTSNLEAAAVLGAKDVIIANSLADTDDSSAADTRNADGNYGLKQWVLADPTTNTVIGLPAKNVKGTVIGFIRGRHSVGNATSAPIMKMYITSADHLTYRGTLFDLGAGTQGGSPWPAADATVRGEQIPNGASITLTSVAAQAGDLLVVELGYNLQGSAGANQTTNLRSRGAFNVAEVAANGDQGALDTWIEFSQDPQAAGDPPIDTDFYLLMQRR